MQDLDNRVTTTQYRDKEAMIINKNNKNNSCILQISVYNVETLDKVYFLVFCCSKVAQFKICWEGLRPQQFQQFQPSPLGDLNLKL